MRSTGLNLEISPTVRGSRVCGVFAKGSRLIRHRAFFARISWLPLSNRWVTESPNSTTERPHFRIEADDWTSAYRATCRAVDKIVNPFIRAALFRALTPIPLAHLIVSDVFEEYEDPSNRHSRIIHAYAVYSWRFIGTKNGYDVTVDERAACRMRGIYDYRYDIRF